MLITKHYFLPEDQNDYEMENNALDYYLSLWDLSQGLSKYVNGKLWDEETKTEREFTEDQYKIIDELNKLFYDILDEREVNLDR